MRKRKPIAICQSLAQLDGKDRLVRIIPLAFQFALVPRESR